MTIKRNVATIYGIKEVDQIGLIEFGDRLFFIHKDLNFTKWFTISEIQTGMSVTSRKTKKEAIEQFHYLLGLGDLEKRIDKAKKELRKRKMKFPLNTL
jgi:hypothetical protein